MSGIDYALKSKVLKEHGELIQKIKQATKKDFETNSLFLANGGQGVIKWNSNENLDNLYIECMFNGIKPQEFDEAIKIKNADYKRKERLQKRISTIIAEKESLFLTLTFNDDTLSKTTPEERRTLVSRYLKEHNAKYVANVDYGAKNHREHYHAIIGTSKVNYKRWLKNGTVNFEHIRLKKDLENDTIKLSKYISKLTNHAIKETTKRCALLYSRE